MWAACLAAMSSGGGLVWATGEGEQTACTEGTAEVVFIFQALERSFQVLGTGIRRE